jgi:hypothetical protein
MLRRVTETGQCLDTNSIFQEDGGTPWTVLTSKLTQMQDINCRVGQSWLNPFFTAVRTGLLSAMLATQADTNALVRLSEKKELYFPAWQCYVFLAFHIPADIESMILYLEGLDQVLNAKVDWSPNLTIEYKVLENFLRQLTDLSRLCSKTGSTANWGVLGRVIERFIERFSRAHVPLYIDDSFYPELRLCLGDLICSKISLISHKTERIKEVESKDNVAPKQPLAQPFVDVNHHRNHKRRKTKHCYNGEK